MPKGRPPVERVTVACFVCGKEIVKRKTDADRNISGRHFCSTKCLWEVGAKPRRRKEQKCERCGEQFYPPWAKEAPARFCSKVCYDKWQRRNRVKKTCETCGSEFWLKPSQAVHLTGRFCKRSCETVSRLKRPLDRMHNGKPAVLDSNGYVKVYEPGHHAAYTGWASWALEHRLVAEQTLGRRLTTDEHVHHINGDKADNRPENLAVMSHGEHSTITGLANAKRLREWEEYRKRYGPLDEETFMA